MSTRTRVGCLQSTQQARDGPFPELVLVEPHCLGQLPRMNYPPLIVVSMRWPSAVLPQCTAVRVIGYSPRDTMKTVVRIRARLPNTVNLWCGCAATYSRHGARKHTVD